jgi:hypothetical protein
MNDSENKFFSWIMLCDLRLFASLLTRRDLSTDNTINIIFGVLASIIGFFTLMVAWTTWKLMCHRSTLPLDNSQRGQFPVSE